MKTLKVHASRQYDIHIGSGLLTQLGALASAFVCGKKVVIISDTNVWPIYGEAVISGLSGTASSVHTCIIPAGEEHKNLSSYAGILDQLANDCICREDVIVALGGGVVGDLAGFAAATFLRGISYIQVPTTLLAMVDSSVGGKTAINLPAGKNLAGAFYQPSLVVCDTDVLSTLPKEVYLDGCAEVIKYGILFDESLFSHLVAHGPHFHLKAVIARCAELKSLVVQSDEFEHGARKLLNLGHTFGHGIESLSNYSVSHGRAVSIGIAMAARAALHAGCCTENTCKQIVDALTGFGLPVSTEFTAQDLHRAAMADKKRHSSHIDLVLPEAIGRCKIMTVEMDKFYSLIEAGL